MSNPTQKFNLLDIMHSTVMDNNQFRPLNTFVQMHDVEKRSDDVGDDDKIYKASNIDYINRFPERHGFDDGIDKEIYDRINPDLDEYQRAAKQNAYSAMLSLWQQHPTNQDLDSGNDAEYA